MARKDANPGKREGAVLRRMEAIKLRVAGKGYEEIARTLDVALSQAYRDVQTVLHEAREGAAEAIEEARAVELRRLDRWLDALDSKIANGDEKAIDTANRIAKRRADLLGLDAPKRTETTGPDGGPIVVTWGGKPPE